MTTEARQSYPSDVSDEEWSFVAPYLTLLRIVRAGAPWRLMPNDLPPWEMVYQQTQRWFAHGSFEAIVHDLRVLIRLGEGREEQPSAVILDSRTLQSTPESGTRAGYDGAKRRRASKVHMSVDTLGQLLAVHITPVNEQDRAQVGVLAEAVQAVTGENVELAFDAAAEAAQAHDIRLEVIKHTEAKRGFVLLPRRWVVERSFGWLARFRRLARDYERLPRTVKGLHFLVFVCLLLPKALAVSAGAGS